ncbi:G-protein coupled receptor [Nemania sp. NC0429]|nr:G-protein coupled receptor [Nemania sp. NC0429]
MGPRQLPEAAANAIVIVMRVTSVLSLIGCFFIIGTFISSRAFRKPINRLIFYASFGNVFLNIGSLFARAFIHDENSAGCQIQGFIIQQFLPSDTLWSLAMAFNVYLTFYFKFDAERLKTMEKWYLLICYGVPFPPSLIYIFISSKSRGRMYSDAILWCCVGTSWDFMKLATFYGPVWVVLLATFSIYIRAGGEIYKRRRELCKLSSTGSNSGIDTQAFHPSEPYPRKTTEVSITSESMSRTDPLWRPGSSPSSESRLPGVYSITISSNQGAPPRAPSNIESSIDAARAHMKRRRSYEANRAAWVYSKYALLFFTALLITWIPSSANRVYSIVHDGQIIVPLEIIAATVLPLQGFWNAVIYLVTSWAAVKSSLSDLRHRVRHGNSSWDYTRRNNRDERPLSFNPTRRNHGGEETDSVIELTGNVMSNSNISYS